MKLYETKNYLNDLVLTEDGRFIDPDTGEILSKEEFESIAGDFNDGVENLCLWYKNLVAEAKMVKAEEDELKKRRQSCEKKSERILNYVGYLLDGKQFSTSKCKVSYTKSTACEIYEGAEVPKEFMRIKEEPDKKLISEYIKQGNECNFAHIVERSNVNLK